MKETKETLVQSPGWEDPLEEDTATRSSVAFWRIPWTEEPGGASQQDPKGLALWTQLPEHTQLLQRQGPEHAWDSPSSQLLQGGRCPQCPVSWVLQHLLLQAQLPQHPAPFM